MSIAGGTTGSIDSLRRTLDKASQQSGSDSIWVFILKEGDTRLRFITEMDEWFEYYEHYNREYGGYHVCSGDKCPSCKSADEQTKRRSHRFLANAYVVDYDKVAPVRLPLDVANRLFQRFERSNIDDPTKSRTLTDRDYTIHRTGSGKNTMYDTTPHQPSAFTKSVSKLNLKKILLDQYKDLFGTLPPGAEDEYPEDEAGEEVPFDPPSSNDDEEVLTEDDLRAMPRPELDEVASILGVEVSDDLDDNGVVEKILASAE